jgi:hypothetical protein
MAIEKKQPKQILDGAVIIIDRCNGIPKQKVPTQRATDPNPLGRWLYETPSEQPWNALASFDFDSSWTECTAQLREESLMIENGSVDDKK